MNDIQVFNFRDQAVRTVIIDGEPWFVASDVCDILGIQNPRDTLSKSIPEDEKGVEKFDTLGGPQYMATVNEPGLYRLIFRSNKSQAVIFQKWVYHEVLPSIRKTGQYNPQLTEDEIVLKSFKILINRNELLKEKIEQDKPKVEFYQQLMDAGNCMTMAQAAKSLGTKYGRNQLFDLLRKYGFLMENREPYSRYVKQGLFRVVLHPYRRGEQIYASATTLITPKGMDYLRKFLISNGLIDGIQQSLQLMA